MEKEKVGKQAMRSPLKHLKWWKKSEKTVGGHPVDLGNVDLSKKASGKGVVDLPFNLGSVDLRKEASGKGAVDLPVDMGNVDLGKKSLEDGAREKYIVNYKYTPHPDYDDELNVFRGDIVFVLRREDDGWVEVEKETQPDRRPERGWVPFNYLRLYKLNIRVVKWSESSNQEIFSANKSGLTPRWWEFSDGDEDEGEEVEGETKEEDGDSSGDDDSGEVGEYEDGGRGGGRAGGRKLTEKQKRIEESQRQQMCGFTVQELYEKGAVEIDGIEGGEDLKGEVCELYKREQWLDYDDYYSRDSWKTVDKNGFYWGPLLNDALWKAMEPSLLLASKFIANIDRWPWWQALFHGPRRNINTARARDWSPHLHGKLESFHIPRAANGDIIKKRTPFDEIARDFRLVIDSSFRTESWEKGAAIMASATMRYAHNSFTRRLEYRRTGRGHTPRPGDRKPFTLITLNRLFIIPLLRDDLSVPERLAAQFNMCATILHETAHAVNFWRTVKQGRALRPNEPYFEDEVVAELGYSLENAIFGGTIRELPSWWRLPSQLHLRPDEVSGVLMCLLVVDFPDSKQMGLGIYAKGGPALLSHRLKTLPESSTRYPIPMTYLWEIQQEAFWELIDSIPTTNTIATSLLRVFPRTYGIYELYDPYANEVIGRGQVRGEDVDTLLEQAKGVEKLKDASPWDKYKRARAKRWRNVIEGLGLDYHDQFVWAGKKES